MPLLVSVLVVLGLIVIVSICIYAYKLLGWQFTVGLFVAAHVLILWRGLRKGSFSSQDDKPEIRENLAAKHSFPLLDPQANIADRIMNDALFGKQYNED